MSYSLICIGKQKKHKHYSSDSESSVNGISPVVIEVSGYKLPSSERKLILF